MIPPIDPLPPPPTVRQRLLAAAEAVCSTDGLYDARIEDMTRRAGIAKGTFYLYFPSKEAIVQEMTREALSELGERCRKAVRGARSLNGRARAIVATHLDFYGGNPGRMRILHQARGLLTFSRPEWQPLGAAFDAHLDLLATLLGTTADGAPEVARESARLLFGAVSGAASQFALAGGGLPAGYAGRLDLPLAQMIRDYILSRSPRPRSGSTP